MLARNGYIKIDPGKSGFAILFSKNPITGFFFLNAKLNLRNVTSMGKKVKNSELPLGNYSNGRIDFDLTSLDTALFKIDSIQFYFKDFLGIFNARYLIRNFSFPLIVSNKVHRLRFQKKLDYARSYEGENISADVADEDYFATRKYMWGDELKRIHWKNSAKTHALVVRMPESISKKITKTNLILNTFIPVDCEVEHQRIISEFMSFGIIKIKEFLSAELHEYDLYINSAEVVKLNDLEKYNRDKISEMIIKNSVFQDQRRCDELIERFGLNSATVITPSWDRVVSENVNLYIYSVKRSALFSLYETAKSKLFFEREDLNGVSRSEFVENFNLLGTIRKGLTYYQLRRIVNVNEKFYSGNKMVSLMN
jgi:hypothetical protein